MSHSAPLLHSSATPSCPKPLKNISRRGFCFILAGPSGTGKTSLKNHLLTQDNGIVPSVSWTTRPARCQELPGKDYIFVSQEEFEEKKNQGAFVETVFFYGHWYGTPKSFIEQTLQEGQDVLLCIEDEGIASLRQEWPLDVVSVFILPPSLSVLRQRLVGRDGPTSHLLKERVMEAQERLPYAAEHDYVVINDVFEQCLHSIEAILTAERNRRSRLHLSNFLQDLMDQTFLD